MPHCAYCHPASAGTMPSENDSTATVTIYPLAPEHSASSYLPRSWPNTANRDPDIRPALAYAGAAYTWCDACVTFG
jgi:hypothetical protein